MEPEYDTNAVWIQYILIHTIVVCTSILLCILYNVFQYKLTEGYHTSDGGGFSPNQF